MQLSYRIIKNHHIDLAQEPITVSETVVDNKLYDSFEVEGEFDEEEVSFNSLDIERFKSHILQKLETENERARQILIEKTKLELEEEAKGIRQRAQEQGFKEGIEKGYQEGLKQGYEAGLEDSKKEAVEIKNGARSLLNQAEEEVKAYYLDNKDSIIRLAGDMAEAIVHQTIDLSDENILMLIKPIVQMYERNQRVVFTCHPHNSPYLKERLGELESLIPGSRFIILEDNNLEKNGCLIENENQIIDLQISKQIKSIVDDLNSMEV